MKNSWNKTTGSKRVTSSNSTSASFFDLKAELQRNQTAEERHSIKRQTRESVSSKTAQDASLSYWDKRVKSKHLSPHLATQPSSSLKVSETDESDRAQSSGSKKRKKRDKDANTASNQAQLDAIRRNLERKAKIYAQLEAGKYAGMSDDQLAETTIDWQRKTLETRAPSPDSPQDRGLDDADPEVEYVDEFGRTRTANLSDVPRELLSSVAGYGLSTDKTEDDDQQVIWGPATQFPVYIPALPRPKSSPVVGHFDPNTETRHRGAGFFKFSRDEETRSRQMDQLDQLRQQTLQARATDSRTSSSHKPYSDKPQ